MGSTRKQQRYVKSGLCGTLAHNVGPTGRLVILGQEDDQSPIPSCSAPLVDFAKKDPFAFCGRFSDLAHLQRAISLLEGSIQFTPVSDRQCAESLVDFTLTALHRFRCLGELSDLEQSIPRQREAIQLISDGHAAEHGYLNRLANSLLYRFQRLGEWDDLEQSISMVKQASQLTPEDHRETPHYLSILGLSLLIRFQRPDELNDLEQLMSWNDACPGNLANAPVTPFRCLGDPSDLNQAISHYSHAARVPSSPTTARFHASQQWISSARSLGHHSLLDAYSTAISLLPRITWIGFSLTQRYHELMQGTDIVREAAAAALGLGCPELAVEWLEQGRSIVWGELFQLRSSFDELSSAYPEHAHLLQQLSLTAALEHAGAARNRSLSSLSQQTQSAGHLSAQQEVDRHRAFAIERDKLLQDIHRLPGFERFLLHKEFSQLRAAAHSGPVVILNAAETRCDALIVLANKENVTHVPLPDFTLRRSGGLQNTIDGLLGHSRVIPCDDRNGQRALRQIRWEPILSALWRSVVKPVLDVLGYSQTLGELPRVFWCPTGPFTFLPIHAAGLYGTQYSQPGHKVFDFVISSYVPTLGILVPPIQDTTCSRDLRVLVVPQPPSDGQSPLPGVHTELDYIRTVIKNSQLPQTTLLESFSGTVEEILALMQDADWVHFACHGVQDPDSPTQSGLCLANQRRLKLSDILPLSHPRGGLAFLSACQTAMGDKNLSDEAVHIAAGMLFAGYGGVITTMWSISDRVAPLVAKDVYEQLFRTGTTPDHREAARALHNAVGCLRDRGASFIDWLPFIHVGL